MIRIFVLLLVFYAGDVFAEVVSSNPTDCEEGYCTAITCDKGYCDGWEGSYKTLTGSDPQGGERAFFFFRNVSGKSAFNIRILVNFNDYFGKYIRRAEINEDGPIHSHIPMFATIPKGTANITFDIFWSDEYLAARQLKKPSE
jgi:hypothetical protein